MLSGDIDFCVNPDGAFVGWDFWKILETYGVKFGEIGKFFLEEGWTTPEDKEFLQRLSKIISKNLGEARIFLSKVIKASHAPKRTNCVGRDILRLCDGTHSVDEITSVLAKRYDEAPQKVKSLVAKFLDECGKEGIVAMLKIPHKAIVHSRGSIDFLSPQQAMIEITSRCNLRCKHCYFYPTDVGQDLPTSTLKIILDKLYRAGVMAIEFTGGEPLLREDFFELLEFCRGKFKIKLATNGCLINETVAKKLANYLIMGLQVSLDGDAETHDNIRGVKGTFEKTLRGIQLLRKYGLPASVAMTVDRTNVNKIRNVVRYAEEAGAVGVQIGFVLPAGRGKTANLLTRQEIRWIKGKMLPELADEYASKTFRVGVSEERKSPCKGFVSRIITISPNGGVEPCPVIKDTLGDLVTRDLKEIVQSPKARFYQQLSPPSREICRGCKHIEFCEGCSAAGIAMRNIGEKCIWGEKYFREKKMLQQSV